MKVILSNYYNTKIDDETVIKNIFKDTYAYEALAELKSTKYGVFFNEIDFKKIKDIYYTGVKKRLRLIKNIIEKGHHFQNHYISKKNYLKVLWVVNLMIKI